MGTGDDAVPKGGTHGTWRAKAESRRPDDATAFRLWHAAAALLRVIEAELRPHGVTHTQLVVLLAIAHLTPRLDVVLARDVIALEALDPNLVSQVVSRLVRAGLVLRRPHPSDGRARALTLTEEGYAMIERAAPALDAAQGSFLARLPPDEREALHAVLGRLSGASDR